jgi:transposase
MREAHATEAGMLTVEDYGRIRRLHGDGVSIRAVARTLHHSRGKVREALANPEPRRYTRTKDPPAPKLGRFKAVIDAILTADEHEPRKQRHTAMQVFRRLVPDGYPGGYDQVRRYIRKKRQRHRETFIPLAHDPGERLECDFGHIQVDFPDGRRQVAVLLPTWSYSNCPFGIALPTERAEAILAGLVAAFDFFGAVPREVWWDNPTTVATAILAGRERRLNERYAALASHYNFDPRFCLPAHGNEKPYTENRVYTLQRWWATPVPQAKDLAELNGYLRQRCLEDRQRTMAGQTETIGQRFATDQAAALPVPARPFDPCIHQPVQVDKYQTVRFDNNRYSVPRRCAFRAVTLKAYVDRVEVVADGQVVARHSRCYERHQQILDPLHYLITLGRRPAALDHSNVYRHWQLPPAFGELRQTLEQRFGPRAGAQQYIRVLQLLAEHPVERVQRAIAGGAAESELIVLRTQRLARRALEPAPTELPEALAHIQVPRPDLSCFDQLLTTGEPAYA